MYKHEKYPEIPKRTLNALDDWAQEGVPPGDFGVAVLTNDFAEAVARADSENQEHLVEIAKYVYNELPLGCWGSKEQVQNWKEIRAVSDNIKP